MRKLSEDTYAVGLSGAGMMLEITLLPSTVSFYNTEFLEIPGPASDISGYMTNKAGPHMPSTTWFGFSEANICACQDHASTRVSGFPPPWFDGAYQWVIPYHYRCVGSASSIKFTDVIQRFTIDAAGTVTVTKGGATVTRRITDP
jgi:hypothetical protein